MSIVDSSPLLLRMESLRSSMSKAERKVIDYTLSSPKDVIHLSVSGLAELSGTSEATVVRACKTLGFDGYQDFKVTLAQNIVTPLENIHEDINSDDSIETVIDKVFQSTIETLNLSRSAVKASTLEEAADLILNAKSIYIFGMGNSHAIASDLQHKLIRLGFNAVAYNDSHLQAIVACDTSEKDVVFAISHSGSSIDIVTSASLAKNHGAKIISLTNIGSSPLSNLSDVCLFTANNETKYRILALNSRIAQMAIIDTIYTILSTRIEDAVDRFHDIEKALENKKY